MASMAAWCSLNAASSMVCSRRSPTSSSLRRIWTWPAPRNAPNATARAQRKYATYSTPPCTILHFFHPAANTALFNSSRNALRKALVLRKTCVILKGAPGLPVVRGGSVPAAELVLMNAVPDAVWLSVDAAPASMQLLVGVAPAFAPLLV